MDDIREAAMALYKKYGSPERSIKYFIDLLRSGIEKGFSVNVAYNGIRMSCGREYGVSEYFTIEDIAEITGEPIEFVKNRIDLMKIVMEERGIDASQYFKEVEDE